MDARSKMGLVMKQYLLKMVYRLLIYFLALILASEVEVRLQVHFLELRPCGLLDARLEMFDSLIVLGLLVEDAPEG